MKGGGEMQSEGLYRHVDTSSLGASYLHPLTLVGDQEDSYCTEIVDLFFLNLTNSLELKEILTTLNEISIGKASH